MRLRLLLSLTLCLVSLPATAQQTGSVLIRNATVLTVTNGTLENTDVLVRDGKINRIGKGLSAPGGVQTVDASGLYLMPGIIDAHSHIATSSVNEATAPVTAEVQIEDVLDPYDLGLYRALAGGVTTSHIMHGSANAIGGQSETIKHRWGVRDPEMLKLDGAPRTIKFALGENPTRVHGRGYGVQPATRMGVEGVIRQAFAEARLYDQAKARAQQDPTVAPPSYSLRLETMADILRGDIIVHCHSYRADEILMLMRVLRDFGVERIVFQHANEAFKVAPELAAFGAGASVFADWWAYKFEVYYSTAYNATILLRNGVSTSINSDSPELNRHLYHEAAKMQHYGDLTDDEALSLITINPAQHLGVADRIGSIEEGKDADLVLFKGHPLSIYGVPQTTWVDGVARFDINRDGDDQRLLVSPTDTYDTVTLYNSHDHERCLQGTSLQEFLLSDAH